MTTVRSKHLGDEAHVVGRHEQRLVEPGQEADQFAPAPWVEARRRLVEDEDGGVHREHGGQRDPLALTQRQAVRNASLEAAHADGGEGAFDAVVDLVGGTPMWIGPNATSSKTVGLKS